MKDYFIWLCHQSNNLYNSALYQIRQTHFETCPEYEYFDQNQMYRTAFKDRLVKVSYAQLCKDFKENKHYQALGGQSAQQCLKSVVEAISSYNKLIRLWWSGELNKKPRIPYYRTSGGLYQITFTSQNNTYDDVSSSCRLSISRENNSELFISEITVPGGAIFKSEQLSEVRIVPGNGQLWAEYVYKTEAIGIICSADIQAAGNILRKVAVQLGISLVEAGKAALTLPKRYHLHLMRRSYRKNGEMRLDAKLIL